MNDDFPNCNILKDPLCISDLVGQGSKFELNTDFAADFDDTEFYGSDDDVEIDDDRKELLSPWLENFEELRLQMTKIDENIYKRITVHGNAEKGSIPQKSRVSIRYNAYWEGEGKPFDSSFLRGSIFKFYSNRDEILLGLEKSIMSMYEGEQAQFVISYKLLFGEMGCPPRIKKRADGLFVIELVAFNEVGDIDAANAISEEDRKKFGVVVEKAKEIHLKGLDFFKQGMHKNACRAFEKAVHILNFCHLENEQEEKEQTKFLIKLYTNLAVCYNKQHQPAIACRMCREIRQLTKHQPSCKAVFNEGRALLALGDFSKARNLLIQAQRQEPSNEEISKELETLEKRFTEYKTSEKTLWQRALGAKETTNETPNDEKSLEFKQYIKESLLDFKTNSTEEKLELPSLLESQEMDAIDELAKELDMVLEFSPLKNAHYIRKK